MGNVTPIMESNLFGDNVHGAPLHLRDLVIPKEIRITNSGMYAVDEQGNEHLFATEPFILSKKILDLEEETEKFEITYRYEGKWRTLVEDRSTFSDLRALTNLSNHSFPVDLFNARKVAEAIRFMCYRSKPPIAYSFSSCGWKQCERKDYFVLGKRVIGAINGEIIFSSTDQNALKVLPGFVSKGDIKEWFALTNEYIEAAPKVLRAIYHSLSPVLMKIVGAPNYCVDISGPSAVGKTTFSRVAISVWGVPIGHNELLRSWNMTKVWGERYASFFSDLPIFLEETQLAKEDNQRDILYMIVNGMGRGRGSLKSTQETKQWNTCLFSTGEVPLTQSTQLEGARSRVLAYWGSPFGDLPNPAMVKKTERVLAKTYGHVGPLFVEWLLDNQDEWDSFKARYEDLCRYLMAEMPSNIESRVAGYVALTWLTAEIYHRAFPGYYPKEFHAQDTLLPLFKEISEEIKGVSLWERALIAVKGWVDSNEPSFAKDASSMDTLPGNEVFVREYYGIFRTNGDQDQVALFTHKLKKFLKDEGFPFESVLKVWKGKKIIQTSGTTYTMPVKFKQKVSRMIVLNLPADGE